MYGGCQHLHAVTLYGILFFIKLVRMICKLFLLSMHPFSLISNTAYAPNLNIIKEKIRFKMWAPNIDQRKVIILSTPFNISSKE